MKKAPQRRGPSVKACVKRLTGITLAELETLSTRDLDNILKIGSIFGVIVNKLKQRNDGKAFNNSFTEHSHAA